MEDAASRELLLGLADTWDHLAKLKELRERESEEGSPTVASFQHQ
jgi:hypothetical protein